MGYIEKNLLPQETVVVRGKPHLLIVLRPLVVTSVIGLGSIVGVLMMVGGDGAIAFLGFLLTGLTALMLLGAVPATIGSVVAYLSNEVAVTDRRVIGKFGLIRRSTLEFPFRQIESIAFDQGLIERLFGGATIRVRGSGTAWVETPTLKNFREFRSAALERVEALQKSERPAIVESA